MTEADSLSLKRCADALELIATFLSRVEPVGEEPCPHPEHERKVTPDSTIDRVAYQCGACGASVS